jgi:hypothetical protein
MLIAVLFHWGYKQFFPRSTGGIIPKHYSF